VRNALHVRRLETDRAELEARAGVASLLLGDSLAMRRIREQIRLCASTPGRVLITGETGTGKEVVARSIHAQSERRSGPWVAVNCAAVPSELIESATNRDLRADIASGRFREDLFHRLNVVPIHIPPLRDRREDVPILVAHFIDTLSKLAGLRAVSLDGSLMARLQQHDWPGNVREVRNTVERLLIFSQGRRPSVALLEELLGESAMEGIGQTAELSGDSASDGLTALDDGLDDGGVAVTVPAEPAGNLRQAVEEFERQHILGRLRAHGGQVAATARELGLERSHLYKKMRALHIDPDTAR
jgi:DNA-binding NtrC family response regulator